MLFDEWLNLVDSVTKLRTFQICLHTQQYCTASTYTWWHRNSPAWKLYLLSTILQVTGAPSCHTADWYVQQMAAVSWWLSLSRKVPRYNLDLWPLMLKTFSAILTHMLITCAVFHENRSAKLASCLINVQPLPAHCPAACDNSLIGWQMIGR